MSLSLTPSLPCLSLYFYLSFFATLDLSFYPYPFPPRILCPFSVTIFCYYLWISASLTLSPCLSLYISDSFFAGISLSFSWSLCRWLFTVSPYLRLCLFVCASPSLSFCICSWRLPLRLCHLYSMFLSLFLFFWLSSGYITLVVSLCLLLMLCVCLSLYHCLYPSV